MDGNVKTMQPFSDLTKDGVVNKYHKITDVNNTKKDVNGNREGIINERHTPRGNDFNPGTKGVSMPRM